MGLQIWLPLTGDLQNKGTGDITFTSIQNVTQNANGKLGGCYSFSGSSYLLGTQNFLSNNTDDWSFACWAKFNTTATGGQTLFSCRTAVNSTGITIIYYGSSWIFDDGTRWQPTASISKDTWYHICFVRKKGIGKYLYINGALDKSTTTTGTPSTVSSTTFAIGETQSSATTVSRNVLNGYLNDVRFYDHALSPAEVKELSKGLVCHYKLDNLCSSDNLIVNGFGELGTENWTSSVNMSTTEIPSGHPEIKASFYGNSFAKEYIPVCRNHRYTISGYVKAVSGKTGNTYPSIYPYDTDKKFIAYYNSRVGFDVNTVTTLSQPLHTGDTVIHAADLSKWRVDTTSHYYYVAVFGYKNSYGEVYDDLQYTQDSPKFGSQTDKSNIDKTNNTITLLSAYTGADRPAGTSICQATGGSSYYYPWGRINLSNITDWTYKTASFTPSKDNRLLAAAYFRWNTYTNVYIAGSKLTDDILLNTEVTDSSGYGNHGTRNGNVTSSYNTPRYDISAVFDGTSAYIEADPLPLETKTISIWLKTPWVSSSGYRLAVHDKNTGLAIGWSSNQLITYVGSSTGGSGSRIIITETNYAANQWNHIAVVKTGSTTRDVYVNGVLATPNNANYWAGDSLKLNIGGRHVGGSYAGFFDGQLSDFRAYVTALTADDVKELYNTSAKIAKDGSLLAYQMKEGE